MFCIHCGREIADNSKFCTFCGMKQTVQAIPVANDKALESHQPSSGQVENGKKIAPIHVIRLLVSILLGYALTFIFILLLRTPFVLLILLGLLIVIGIPMILLISHISKSKVIGGIGGSIGGLLLTYLISYGIGLIYEKAELAETTPDVFLAISPMALILAGLLFLLWSIETTVPTEVTTNDKPDPTESTIESEVGNDRN